MRQHRHEWDLIMLKLLLVREIKTKNRHGLLFKIGRMISAGLFVIRLRIKEKRDVKIKVKRKTAIPTGKYTVIVTMSQNSKELPLILNVPNFSGVPVSWWQ